MSRDDPARSHSDRWAELAVAVDAAASARDDDASTPGVPFGRFELLEQIGDGGMGVVFRARDTNLGREVALKLLNLAGDQAEAAVLHEAQCLAKLSHPNVVALYDTGKVGDELFLTMELVAGMDGRALFARFLPTWQQAIEIFLGAGRGLAAAHAAGIEHGDFKPENMLVSQDRRVRVADFGVARALRDQINAGDDNTAGREETGGRGTVNYMAPERLRGRRGDARSDQFSFCVALWECVYGGRPFVGETRAELLTAIELGMLWSDEPLRGAPRRLRKVIEKGLSPEPVNRWPDMGSLLEALTEIRKAGERRRRQLRAGLVASGLAVVCSLATAVVIEQRAPGDGAQFVSDARMSWSAHTAIAAARGGDVAGALSRLESAEQAERSQPSSHMLALASEQVALEFERRLLFPDAVLAWHLTIMFARDEDDREIELRAWNRLEDAATMARQAPR
ncbi:serine/threonine-protein kinase [Enhygromyxa salina]|uniref:serine/threonine-protein kinase n=1 Tax=Enhygromyxa salina TaxID=215803 RepID=UPI0015E77066|nr:serine/threonine-protein kinase [Enhygromyxa salina]